MTTAKERQRAGQRAGGLARGEMMREQNADRDEWICDAYRSGMPTTAIAQEVGLSRQRVNAITRMDDRDAEIRRLRALLDAHGIQWR